MERNHNTAYNHPGNLVTQHPKLHKTVFSWVRDKKQSSAEVDLAISFRNKVIPGEIKSGSEGTLKSLHQYVKATNHPYAVRMYAGEFKVSKTKKPGGKPYLLMNLPYYLGTKNKRVPRILPEQLQTLSLICYS